MHAAARRQLCRARAHCRAQARASLGGAMCTVMITDQKLITRWHCTTFPLMLVWSAAASQCTATPHNSSSGRYLAELGLGLGLLRTRSPASARRLCPPRPFMRLIWPHSSTLTPSSLARSWDPGGRRT